MVVNYKIQLKTKGNTDIINITDAVEENLQKSGLKNGVVNLFVPGATGGITTIEYEPGLVKDFRNLLEKIAPQKGGYFHNRSHFDGNAHSHLRASLLGPNLSVPFVNSQLTLGVWQQIVFIDFDNRPRQREIVMQIMGD